MTEEKDKKTIKIDDLTTYLESIETLTKNITADINKIKEINKVWLSKLEAEKIQKEKNLEHNGIGL